MSSRSYSDSTLKKLWGLSGNRCALCKIETIITMIDGKPEPIAEMAHISGLNPDSPRYNPEMEDKERNSYENIILLCPTCHEKVDRDVERYTEEFLIGKKEEHEKWVDNRLTMELPNVTFEELEVITKYLLNASFSQHKEELTVIPPEEKIMKNNFSFKVSNHISRGLIGVNQVKDYLNKNIDPEFSERLKAGFIEKYLELKNRKLNGDDLFFEMLDFASNGSADFSKKAAALTVLTYYFEICEVFEK